MIGGLALLRLLSARRGLGLGSARSTSAPSATSRDGTTMPPAVFDEIRGCSGHLDGRGGAAAMPSNQHAIDILFGFRFGLDLFANVRPVRCLDDRLSPLRHFGAGDRLRHLPRTPGLYVNVGGQVRRQHPTDRAINEDVSTAGRQARIIGRPAERRVPRAEARPRQPARATRCAHATSCGSRVFRGGVKEVPGRRSRAYVDALACAAVADRRRCR